MSFIDTAKLPVIERLPGWHGRYFHSPSMTFAHYDFDRGSSIHEHSHPQEEVWNVIEGVLEITIDGVTQRSGPGFVGIVPPNTPHCVKAITAGKAVVVDYPLREVLLHNASTSESAIDSELGRSPGHRPDQGSEAIDGIPHPSSPDIAPSADRRASGTPDGKQPTSVKRRKQPKSCAVVPSGATSQGRQSRLISRRVLWTPTRSQTIVGAT